MLDVEFYAVEQFLIFKPETFQASFAKNNKLERLLFQIVEHGPKKQNCLKNKGNSNSEHAISLSELLYNESIIEVNLIWQYTSG